MPPSRLRQLSDLAALRDALEVDQAARERRERAAAVAKAEVAREANLFRDAIGAVAPLKVAARATHRQAPPEPIAHQHRRDEAEALAASLSDDFDPDIRFLESDDALSWQRDRLSPDVIKKLRSGYWIIQAEADLHGHRTEGAREMVNDFLREAVKRRLRCVRIVHGKGHGSVGKQPVLKGKVKRWLMQKEEVMAFCQAREHDGGGGALMVLLRPS